MTDGVTDRIRLAEQTGRRKAEPDRKDQNGCERNK
jgi:hypothetical protein